jgi:hypothetical protein
MQKICDKCDHACYYLIKVYIPLKGERWWCFSCVKGERS